MSIILKIAHMSSFWMCDNLMICQKISRIFTTDLHKNTMFLRVASSLNNYVNEGTTLQILSKNDLSKCCEGSLGDLIMAEENAINLPVLCML